MSTSYQQQQRAFILSYNFCMCNTMEMARHNEMFVSVISLKCTDFDQNGISNSIRNNRVGSLFVLIPITILSRIR